jgi:hypothetical protein
MDYQSFGNRPWVRNTNGLEVHKNRNGMRVYSLEEGIVGRWESGGKRSLGM